MNAPLLVLCLDDRRVAVPVAQVERLIRSVEITTVPDSFAPRGESLLGVINLHGKIVPVYNLRPRFHIVDREVALTDHIVVVRSGERVFGLLVDAAREIVTPEAKTEPPIQSFAPSQSVTEGAMVQDGSILFIQDLESFLSAEGEAALQSHFEKVA